MLVHGFQVVGGVEAGSQQRVRFGRGYVAGRLGDLCPARRRVFSLISKQVEEAWEKSGEVDQCDSL